MRRLFEAYPIITEDEINQAIDVCIRQIRNGLKMFNSQFPKAYSVHNFYDVTENVDWTTGFWTGEVWLAYEHSKDKYFLEAAMIQVESFLRRIENKIDVNHHDMGFLYSPSCVAAYKLVGSEKGKEAALLAADQLISRFQEKGEFIQAWGSLNDPDNYRLIIDCLLNLPLLYWAAEVTGDRKYKQVAQRHIHTALSNVIRDDYSTWHTFFFDPETGEPSHGATCQGYRDGSAWARGQAWGIYGLAIAYTYTRKEEYIHLFEEVTHFFLRKLPKDLVPYWDLEFTEGSEEPRDASSAAITVCGILEMAKYMEVEKANYYIEIAKQIVKSLYDHYAVKNLEESNGLLLHSTYSKHSPYNSCNHYGVDECNIWGDYYYFEALTRLSMDWKTYW